MVGYLFYTIGDLTYQSPLVLSADLSKKSIAFIFRIMKALLFFEMSVRLYLNLQHITTMAATILGMKIKVIST